MSDVRGAVFGTSGWMGKDHSMAYRTFPDFPGTAGGTAEVVVLVKVNPHAAAKLAFRAPGAKILPSRRDVVSDPEVDLIDICLPDSLHSQVAKAALPADKHVYCETPLPDTAAQARELADIDAAGVIRLISFGQPMSPTFETGHHICQIVDVCMESSRLGAWASIV